VVTNCTLINNTAVGQGGGAYYCTLNNCTLRGNSATLSGGGAYQGALNNCIVVSNSATYHGGGAYSCTLNNCTLAGNRATSSGYSGGGGVDSATLYNCIVYYNTSPSSPNYSGSTLNYCCTTPRTGVGCIANPPLFVDLTNNNLRLQSNSPCINAGLNAYAPGLTDLDGNPRIVGGTVDIGAYECQSPALLDYYVWLQGYGLPTTASALYVDSDGDGLNNWQEWLAGTNPTNAASALRLQLTVVLPAGVTLTWASVTNRTYFVQRATSLVPPPGFSLLQTNIPGLPGTTSFTDTNPPAPGPAFYRVGVQP
jgi:parallel beta-helix repeat protein